jgi:STE24 endopeptidase
MVRECQGKGSRTIAQFDPAAATAAYLQALSPAEHARATAYTQGGNWLLLWSALVAIAAAWLILKSGLLWRVRQRLERTRPRPLLVAFCCGILFMIADFVLELAWMSYARWWREKSYALTSQSWTGWFGEELIDLAITVLVGGLFVMLLYLLIRRSPKRWWAWGSGMFAIFYAILVVLGPIFVEPLFNTYTPAPAGPLRDQVVAMAEASGVPSDKIYVYNGSKQSNRYTANVSGMFGSARVAMSDTMFSKGADLAEVRGVVGHEMGHYAEHHSIWMVVAFSLLAFVFLRLSDRLYPWVLRLTGESGRVSGIADPAGFPVLSIVVTVLLLLATPLTNSFFRIPESRADAFSLRHVHEPDGLAKALVKTIAYRASSPTRLEEVIFYDHPSVERRVRRSMDWKAAHPNEVGAPPN